MTGEDGWTDYAVEADATVPEDGGQTGILVRVTEPQEETEYKRRGMSVEDAVGTLLLNEVKAMRSQGGIKDADLDRFLAGFAPRQKRGHVLRELADRGLLAAELEDLRRSGNLPRPPAVPALKPNR